MPVREMKHPHIEIEEDEDGLRIRLRVPQSTFGTVEVVLSLEEVETLVESLEQAAVFAGADYGDTDGV